MATGPQRWWRAEVGYIARAPGTHALFAAVVVTALVLRGLDAVTATRVLQEQSTNLLRMSEDAPRVLVASAFLLDPAHLWKELVLFTVVLVPVERWIGTARAAAVFVAGHVGATVATTVAIWLQVRSGVGGGDLTYAVDVGASYGVAAVAGVLVFRLRPPWSTAAAVGLVALAAIALLRTGTFTDWGHMCALVIGLALASLVRPDVTPGRRRRLGRVGGALLLGAAAVVLVVLVVADTDVVLPPPAALAATVLGPIRCGRGCDEVRVRLAAGTAVLRLPVGTDAPTGRTLAVRPVGRRSGRVRLARVAHRVSVSGLLGEVAVAAAGVGLVLLLTVGRGPRSTVRP